MVDGASRVHLPPGTEAIGDDLAEPALAGGLAAVVAHRWSAQPAVPVLCAPADEGRWWTAGELEESSRRAAGALAGAGLRAGDRMLWCAQPSVPSVVAFLGALRIGTVVVPVGTALSEREIGHVVREVRPNAAVVVSPEQARWVRNAAGARAGPIALFSPHELAGPARTDRRAGRPVPDLDAAGWSDPALVVFTSGTSGSPKGAVLTHANLWAGISSLHLAWRWGPEDTLVLTLPLFHVHGLVVGLLGTFAAGGSVVLLDRFTPAGVLDVAREARATLFFGVPTMYHRLLASGRAGELSRLRLCVSGSAPLPAGLWLEVERSAGVEVLERYGMTETLLTLSNPYDGERRPGTVGLPLPGVHVSVGAAPGDGVGGTVPAGAEGELWVRGPSVFNRYWDRPAATAEAFVDGWFRTGDAVVADDRGYFTVLGRRLDVIITGGFNVYPAEIEGVLLAHPGVAEAAVAGVASEEWGEEVRAWVVRAMPGDIREDLLSFATERLAPYKRPRAVCFVDELPRNAMGKVDRRRLRDDLR